MRPAVARGAGSRVRRRGVDDCKYVFNKDGPLSPSRVCRCFFRVDRHRNSLEINALCLAIRLAERLPISDFREKEGATRKSKRSRTTRTTNECARSIAPFRSLVVPMRCELDVAVPRPAFCVAARVHMWAPPSFIDHSPLAIDACIDGDDLALPTPAEHRGTLPRHRLPQPHVASDDHAPGPSGTAPTRDETTRLASRRARRRIAKRAVVSRCWFTVH